MYLKNELQSIISGIGRNSKTNLIAAAAHHLGKSTDAGGDTETIKLSKNQEATKLTEWIDAESLWFTQLDESRFIARGAEQRVYLDKDPRFVIKLNDTIFYEYWLDYFHNLLIHNVLFPQTAYQLIGFFKETNSMCAVVRQPFIEITAHTDTARIEEFLSANGFTRKKNNDYHNQTLGIVLEDLHDENVLTNRGVLFFIDTTFYLLPSFYTE
jgi:hypothetical protein